MALTMIGQAKNLLLGTAGLHSSSHGEYNREDQRVWNIVILIRYKAEFNRIEDEMRRTQSKTTSNG